MGNLKHCDHCDRAIYLSDFPNNPEASDCSIKIGTQRYRFILCKTCRAEFIKMTFNYLIMRNSNE